MYISGHFQRQGTLHINKPHIPVEQQCMLSEPNACHPTHPPIKTHTQTPENQLHLTFSCKQIVCATWTIDHSSEAQPNILYTMFGTVVDSERHTL